VSILESTSESTVCCRLLLANSSVWHLASLLPSLTFQDHVQVSLVRQLTKLSSDPCLESTLFTERIRSLVPVLAIFHR